MFSGRVRAYRGSREIPDAIKPASCHASNLHSYTSRLKSTQGATSMESATTAPTVRFDPASQEFAWHAYEHYAELRRQSPVHRLIQPDGSEVWLVTRYEDVRAALADPRLSRDDRLIQRVLKDEVIVPEVGQTQFRAATDMLSRDAPEHTRLRRLVSRAFTSRRIERLRPAIEDLTERLLDEMDGAGEVDLLATLAYPLPITVTCDLVGVPHSDRERLRVLTEQIFSTAEGKVSDETQAESWAALHQYVSDLVQATAPLVRSDIPVDDQPSLTHALVVAAEHQDRLTQEELVDMLRLLLHAGIGTTADLIGNGMLALLRHPVQRDLLVRRPELLPNAVEELLRYDGVAERAPVRITKEPVTIGGVTIPAHRMVGLVVGSADRDPDHFPDPDRLDVSRPCPPHVGFGHGIHFCLGAPLARLETQVALGGLLSRFPTMELACPVEDLRYRYAGYLVRGLHSLPVRLHAIAS